MSETIKNLGKNKRPNKKNNDREYEKFINDDLIFSIDEVLGVLGPRRETI